MTTRVRGVSGSADNSELEIVTVKLAATQRNYEMMSRMMTAKAKELDQLQAMFDEESSNRVRLSVQLEEAQQRMASLQSQLARLSSLPDQLTAAQAEIQRLKFDSNVVTGKSSQLEERMSGCVCVILNLQALHHKRRA